MVAWKSAVDPVDFPVYYDVGTRLLSGDYELYPSGLYDPTTVGSVGGHGFRYAPILAFAFVPLALLPIKAAAFIFFWLKAAAFVHAFRVLARRLEMWQDRRRLMIAAVIVTGGYLLEEFRGGNVQFLITYLMVVAFDQAERGNVAVPAFALATAIAAKITPVAVLVYLVVRRGPRLIVASVITLLALWAAPALVWGMDHNKKLMGGFVAYSASALGTPPSARDYSLRGALVGTHLVELTPETVTTVWIIALLLALATMVVIVRSKTTFPFSPTLEFGLVLAALPLLSPHTQRIHFSVLSVPAACLAGLAFRRVLPFRTAAMLALGLTAAASTVLPLALASRRLSLAYMDLFPYTISTLVLCLVLLAILLRVRTAGFIGPATEGDRPT